jgi:long-chain acyl-CoA synthetase
MNLGMLPEHHARYRSGHTAFIFEDRPLTWQELNREANRSELMLAYWAAAKTGLVIVPCSPLLQDSGLGSLLQDSDTSLVIAEASFAPALERLAPSLPAIDPGRRVLTGGEAKGFVTYENFVANASTEAPEGVRIEPQDVYNIMYSSGTTGLPKGIVHTHEIRCFYASLFASVWRMTPESVIMHAGSIVFNGAMVDLMPWAYVGGTYVLLKAFEAGTFIREAEKRRATHVMLVPSQIAAILHHPDYDPKRLESLEMILSLGAPLPLEHKKKLMEQLPGRFYELYGLTEGFMTVLDRGDAERKQGSVGAPMQFNQMRILDSSGKPCKPGEVGEICGRGPLLMSGYYKRPDLTAQAVIDGWLHTGDMGHVDEEGFLYLADRKKDMIITGGVNVYPRDIEDVAATHPAVREAAVFGAQEEKWGETPVAALVLREGEQLSPASLKDWINARVGAKFQRLSDVILLSDLPRNVAGKTLKRQLREDYEKGLFSNYEKS